MIKLIGIDIDHTLLASDGTVPAENCTAIREAIARGIKIAITSGRLAAEIRGFQGIAGAEGQSLIACNGAYVYVAEQDRTDICALPADKARAILGYAQRESMECYGFRPNFVYSSIFHQEDPHFQHWFNMLSRWGIDVKSCEPENFLDIDDTLLKIVFVDEDDAKLSAAREYVTGLGGLSVASSWKTNFEVMEGSVDKGSALLRLGEALGAARAEVMAIGDNDNDVPMLRAAGLSVAMGNAADAIKAEATHVTGTNDECGVGQAIRRWALED